MENYRVQKNTYLVNTSICQKEYKTNSERNDLYRCPVFQTIAFCFPSCKEQRQSCIVCFSREPRITYIFRLLSLARLFANLPLSNFGRGRLKIMPNGLTLIKAASGDTCICNKLGHHVGIELVPNLVTSWRHFQSWPPGGDTCLELPCWHRL